MAEEQEISERDRSKSDRLRGAGRASDANAVRHEKKSRSQLSKRAGEPAAAGDIRVDAEPTGELLGEQE